MARVVRFRTAEGKAKYLVFGLQVLFSSVCPPHRRCGVLHHGPWLGSGEFLVQVRAVPFLSAIDVNFFFVEEKWRRPVRVRAGVIFLDPIAVNAVVCFITVFAAVCFIMVGKLRSSSTSFGLVLFLYAIDVNFFLVEEKWSVSSLASVVASSWLARVPFSSSCRVLCRGRKDSSEFVALLQTAVSWWHCCRAEWRLRLVCYFLVGEGLFFV